MYFVLERLKMTYGGFELANYNGSNSANYIVTQILSIATKKKEQFYYSVICKLSNHISLVINRQMYHYNLGPSLRQRFNPKQKRPLRYDSAERFSSFQSPPPSDHDLEEFSDYESPKKQKVQAKGNKQKSYILVEQLPLQFHSAEKRKKQKESSKQKQLNENVNHNKSISYHQRKESQQHKSNLTIKYNYLQQVNKQLSAIKQDQREYLRQSMYATHLHKNFNHVLPIPAPFPPPIAHPHYPPYNYLLDEELKMQDRIVIEEQKLRTEELKLKNALLQQQNITLKERIFYLQSELRKKSQIRQVQSISPKINKALEEELQSTRKETKQRLLDQIGNLQSRCQQMKEEMTAYKLRQQERLSNLLKEQKNKKQIIHVERKQQMNTQTANEYYAKFVEVFLNMVQKLPLKLQPSWSKKKKIAVGWKIVKHFVRKALKLGISPPTLVQREELQ